jgi:hypothetical protein
VQGGCCQAEGRRKCFIIIVLVFVVIIISYFVVMIKSLCMISFLDFF